MMDDSDLVVHIATGPADADLATWATDELASLGWLADGLYVATSTAGRSESVEFWRAAAETGLAFANPRIFPWTLANSPTGSIAKALDVRGPTYTLVGRAEAVAGVLEHAADDLTGGVVADAAVIAVDVDGDCPLIAAALVSSGTVARLLSIVVDDVGDGRPVHILRTCLDSWPESCGGTDARSAGVDRRSVHSRNV